jgi:hypothetical protein
MNTIALEQYLGASQTLEACLKYGDIEWEGPDRDAAEREVDKLRKDWERTL